ncbi:Sodium channel protein 60E [Portunus trituberculatus]|uniref:Sodium channel protein 60E n=1 Tax=Portunus trituberculatus TaxID=210409 RepID=A0A5B7JY15_PORTR|nr:Sodium channel protein 60E [Portunus trituberculatus]
MMIFRILCGEWVEPLWDCMRAEKNDGSETCLAIFLPALVMGNFMVLNLFLALLLNSFNSEELKSRQDDLEDESRILQLFVRLREQHLVTLDGERRMTGRQASRSMLVAPVGNGNGHEKKITDVTFALNIGRKLLH